MKQITKDLYYVGVNDHQVDLFEGQFIYSTKFTNSRAIRFWDKFSASFESNEHQDDEVWRTWTIRKIKK